MTAGMERDPDRAYGGPRTVRPTTTTERRAEVFVGLLFIATILAALGLIVSYIIGANTQVDGVLLAVAFAGLGGAIVVWVQYLMHTPTMIEARHPIQPNPAADVSPGQVAMREAESGFTRRRMLIGMLFASVGGLVTAIAVPLFSLGPLPGRALFVTKWKKGSRVVDVNGNLVHASQIPINGIMTVFPEGAPGDAMSQTVLLNVGPGLLQLPADRASWAPQGFIAYSKLCTHAGCPVGLFRATEHDLMCPCHQSTFDVLDGAQVTFGPAPRPLPQLPIQLQPDGTFVALGGFPEPVGPAFWNQTSGGGA